MNNIMNIRYWSLNQGVKNPVVYMSGQAHSYICNHAPKDDQKRLEYEKTIASRIMEEIEISKATGRQFMVNLQNANKLVREASTVVEE